jgi:hypothetical protein
MCPAIDNPASFEIRTVVICFLHAKIVSAAEIYRELYGAVYCQNVTNVGI